jgi:hypothetical protein
MEKSLSFFRVFDIAFFAPGILLFAAIWYRFFPEISIADIEKSTPRAIAVMTVSLAFIYLLGLLCHGFQRAIWELVSRPASVTKQAWFDGLDRAAREELALYFWYMRATCWNLAVAVITSSFLFPSCFPGIILLGSLVSVALMLLGADFNRSMHRAVHQN